MANKKWLRREKESHVKQTLDQPPSKLAHKRKFKTHIREWFSTDDQFSGEGIAEYQSSNADYCSEVNIVLPSSSESLPTSECNRAVVLKSECPDDENNAKNTEIFSKDLIACYLHEAQSKTFPVTKNRSAKTGDTWKRNKLLNERRDCKQTNQKETRKDSSLNYTNLQCGTFITAEHESLLCQNLPNRTRLVKPCSTLKPNKTRRAKESIADSSTLKIPKINTDGHVTCPTHVYAFHRGLVPSKEAGDLESSQPQHVLPPVIAERVGKTPEQKRYRLTLERGAKNKNKIISSDYMSSRPESNVLNDPEEGRIQSKLVAYQTFSAENVIPVSQNGRRYFDFKGYIEFLYKERNLRKASSKHSTAYNSDEYEWESIASDSWFNNIGTVSVKDVYNYNRMLDIKGCQIRLDENPTQRRCQKMSHNLPVQNTHQHCCLGNSKKRFFKPTKGTQLKKRTQKEKAAVIIERLSSKFQFTMAGRPPSSDDSGFGE